MKKICIIMSVILMLLVVGCAPPGLPPEPTPPGESDTLVGQAFRPGMVIAGDYSPPWDLATGEMEFTTTPEGFSDSTTDISLDVDVRSDDYIYYQGYYYNSRAGGWEAYELDGTRYIVDGAATNWIVHSAGATIPFTGPFDMLVSGENYILMYSCEWDAGWHCGPRTLGDTEPHWTIQSFTVCGAGEVVDGASCVAVSGAITEVCDNRADDDHDSNVDCDDADCSGDPACGASAAPPSPSCMDTDGGVVETVGGEITVVDAAGTTTVYRDTCGGTDSNVKEVSCVGTSADFTIIDCTTLGLSCQVNADGLAYCGAPAAPPSPSCTDTEGSADATVGGQVTFFDAADVVTSIQYDTCNDATHLEEISCTIAGAASAVVICSDIDPAYVCVTGPAGGGDYCGAPAALPSSGPEVLCNNGLDDDTDGLIDCADTDCFADVACTASCTEYDSGDDPGTASFVELFPSGITEADSCVDARNLNEMICDAATGTMTNSMHDCTIGSGSCETDINGYGYCAPPIDYCNDNEDGGFKPEIPGHNLFRDATDPAGPQEGIVRDSCMSTTQLLEGTCSGTALVKTTVDCTLLDPAWKCQVTSSGDSLCGPTGLPGAMLPSARADFCHDADASDPTTPSTLKYRGSGVEFEMVETCKDATTVMEHWCSAGSVNTLGMSCGFDYCHEDANGQAYCG